MNKTLTVLPNFFTSTASAQNFKISKFTCFLCLLLCLGVCSVYDSVFVSESLSIISVVVSLRLFVINSECLLCVMVNACLRDCRVFWIRVCCVSVCLLHL